MKKVIILLLLIPIFVFPKGDALLDDPEKGCPLAVDNMIKILNQSKDEKYEKFKVEIVKMKDKIIKECIKESTYKERKCIYEATIFDDALKCVKKSKPVKIEKKTENKIDNKVLKECKLVVDHMIAVSKKHKGDDFLLKGKGKDKLLKVCSKEINSKERSCILNSKTFEDIKDCKSINNGVDNKILQECKAVVDHVITIFKNSDSSDKNMVDMLLKNRYEMSLLCVEETNSKYRNCILKTKTFEEVKNCEDKYKKKGK